MSTSEGMRLWPCQAGRAWTSICKVSGVRLVSMSASSQPWKKTKDIEEFHCHGGLVFDELKLSENISVKASGELSGFVDLGPFTDDGNKAALSDHGLVVMFQPFQGR